MGFVNVRGGKGFRSRVLLSVRLPESASEVGTCSADRANLGVDLVHGDPVNAGCFGLAAHGCHYLPEVRSGLLLLDLSLVAPQSFLTTALSDVFAFLASFSVARYRASGIETEMVLVLLTWRPPSSSIVGIEWQRHE